MGGWGKESGLTCSKFFFCLMVRLNIAVWFPKYVLGLGFFYKPGSGCYFRLQKEDEVIVSVAVGACMT